MDISLHHAGLNLQISILESRQFAERERAHRHLKSRFDWRNYSSPTLTPMPDRTTIVVEQHTKPKLRGSITVNIDGAFGLPLDRLVRGELDDLRTRGGSLFQISKLAADSADESKAMVGALMSCAFLFGAEVEACQTVVVEVNPRHTAFYRRVMGFRTFAAPALDPKVNAPAHFLAADAPALIKRLLRIHCERTTGFKASFFSAEQAEHFVSAIRLHRSAGVPGLFAA